MLGEEDAEECVPSGGRCSSLVWSATLVFDDKGSGDILDDMSYDCVPFTNSEMILNVWLSQKQ